MKTITLAFLILTSARLAAQPQSSAAVDLTIALDRSEYLPGEVMTFRVSLHNPAAQSIEIYDPWQAGGIGVQFAAEGDGLRVHAFGGVWRNSGGSGLWLQQGETVTREFRSDQPFDGAAVPAIHGRGAPTKPGRYVIALMYRNRIVKAEFRVLPAEIESFAGTRQAAGDFIYTYVLKSGEQRYRGRDTVPRAEQQSLEIEDLRGWQREKLAADECR